MRTRTVLRVAAPAAVTLALAGSAVASPASGPAGAGGAPVRGATTSAATHSRRFAGWEVHGTASSFTMNAVIDVPALKCGKADRAIVPGVGGYYGTGRADFSEAGLFVGCYGGKAHYWTFFVLNGADVSYPKLKVKPTDTVIFTVPLNSTQTTLSVDDKSTGVDTTITGPGVAKTRNPWVGDSGWLSSSGSLEGVRTGTTRTDSPARSVLRPILARNAFSSTRGLHGPLGPTRYAHDATYRPQHRLIDLEAS